MSALFLTPATPTNMNCNESLSAGPIAHIHGLSQDGRGIALVNQKVTFIKNALANEIVEYRILNKRPSFDEAIMTKLLTPATERVIPDCEHFSICGGCSLQHMSSLLQLQYKQQSLLEQLQHFGHVQPLSILPPLSGQTLGYRRKARLGVKYVFKKGKLLIGFREKSSRYLADLQICEVLHPKIGKQFALFLELISSLSCAQHIPQLEIAIGDTEAALIFRHMQNLTDEDRKILINFGSKHQFHIYLQPNSPEPVSKIYPDDGFSRLTYTIPDENLHFNFHPLDFTQINLEVNRLMIRQALNLLQLKPQDNVLDLFCGIGNFTLPIAKYCRKVTGVEGNAEMILRAEENAKLNNIKNAQWAIANLMQVDSVRMLDHAYDKIVLDPPRAGAKEILPIIGKLSAQKILYISCHPATLARDAGILVHDFGYQLTQLGILNMFPHTAHIEAMALFERK